MQKIAAFAFAPQIEMSAVTGLFLRLLGALYVFHFATIMPQIAGIIGPHGLSPVATSLSYHASVSLWAPLFNPTLAWISPSTPFLTALDLLGMALGLGFALGYRHIAMGLTVWAIQLSFANSSMFYGFIWDTCLTQVAFGVLFLTTTSRQRSAVSPPRLGIWVMRFLLFHIMFMMATCKIFSPEGDWRHFEFLKWFYADQPMPSVVSWWLAQLPAPYTAVFSLATMLIETAVALVFFVPARWRRVREIGFFMSCGLQLLIFMSGNFGYFNLLMIALSLFCLTDISLPSARAVSPRRNRQTLGRWAQPFVAAVAAVFIVANAAQYAFFDLNQMYSPYEDRQTALEKFLYPFVTYHLIVPYNIFGTIAHTHRELVIEASADGASWTELRPLYGPGALDRAPAVAAPFQWRLDHELFYAGQMVRQTALDGRMTHFVDVYWLAGLGNGLLAGTPEILRLFPPQAVLETAPKFLRLSLFDYRFTDLGERRATGRWWQRSLYMRSEVASVGHPFQQPWPFKAIGIGMASQ